MNDALKALLVMILLVILVMIPNIKHVSPKQAMIIERFGKFHKIIDHPGFHILIPLYERAIQTVSLDPIKQHIHLDDKVTLDYVYEIIDVKQFVYQAIDSIHAFHEEFIHSTLHDEPTYSIEDMQEIAEHYGMNILECKINNQ